MDYLLSSEARSWEPTVLAVEGIDTNNTNWFYDMAEEK